MFKNYYIDYTGLNSILKGKLPTKLTMSDMKYHGTENPNHHMKSFVTTTTSKRIEQKYPPYHILTFEKDVVRQHNVVDLCMYACNFVCVRAHLHIYTNICICLYVYLYLYMWMCVYVHTHIYIHIHTCAHTHIFPFLKKINKVNTNTLYESSQKSMSNSMPA